MWSVAVPGTTNQRTPAPPTATETPPTTETTTWGSVWLALSFCPVRFDFLNPLAHQLGRIAGREQILVGKADGFLGVVGVDDDLAHAGLPVMEAPAVQLWRLRADRHGAGGSPGSACRHGSVSCWRRRCDPPSADWTGRDCRAGSSRRLRPPVCVAGRRCGRRLLRLRAVWLAILWLGGARVAAERSALRERLLISRRHELFLLPHP